MLKTFFKTALRKILKTKTHAAINLLGLSIGMACAIIIFLFVQHELSYDHSSRFLRSRCNWAIRKRRLQRPMPPC